MRLQSTDRCWHRMLLGSALMLAYAAPGLLPAARDAAHALDHALDHALVDATPPGARHRAMHSHSTPGGDGARHHQPSAEAHAGPGGGHTHSDHDRRPPHEPDGPGVHTHGGLAGLLIVLVPDAWPDGRLHQDVNHYRLTVDVHQAADEPERQPGPPLAAASGGPTVLHMPTSDEPSPRTPPPKV